MLEKTVGFVKQHPVAIGASVVAIVAVLYVVNAASAGSGQAATAASGPSDSQLAAGVQLQQIQSGASVAAQTAAAQLQLGLAHEATASAANTLAAQTQQTANAIAGNVALASLDEKKFESTLLAQVQGQQIQAQSDATKAQYATIQYQADAQVKQTNAILQAQVQQAQIAAQPKGLFSWLFG